jgi:cyclic pyranopterin phosphate synthase
MRDVSHKPNSLRSARAQATLHCLPATIAAVRAGITPKVDPVGVARIAAVQAAKNTSLLVPYCHQVPLDYVGVEIELKEGFIYLSAQVKAVWKTGVEMEALVAVTAAALTLYDMLKPIDETMEMGAVRLLEKSGGESEARKEDYTRYRCGVLVTSDRVSRGEREDLSGTLAKERLESCGVAVVEYKVIPDDEREIQKELLRLCDEARLDVVVTTGGTGLGVRDVTAEVTAKLLDRSLPGVSELLRAHGQERVRYSMLSRGVAGVRGTTLVVNLPGSVNAVRESFDVLFPWLFHALRAMEGGEHEDG